MCRKSDWNVWQLCIIDHQDRDIWWIICQQDRDIYTSYHSSSPPSSCQSSFSRLQNTSHQKFKNFNKGSNHPRFLNVRENALNTCQGYGTWFYLMTIILQRTFRKYLTRSHTKMRFIKIFSTLQANNFPLKRTRKSFKVGLILCRSRSAWPVWDPPPLDVSSLALLLHLHRCQNTRENEKSIPINC